MSVHLTSQSWSQVSIGSVMRMKSLQFEPKSVFTHSLLSDMQMFTWKKNQTASRTNRTSRIGLKTVWVRDRFLVFQEQVSSLSFQFILHVNLFFFLSFIVSILSVLLI